MAGGRSAASKNEEKPPRSDFPKESDPNGIPRELNITIPFEVVV